MQPKDVLWRILESLDEKHRTLEDSIQYLDPKNHGDIISAIEECQRLTNTQKNLINRLRRRYQ